MGNLDGAPLALRYQANALALKAERARRLARATDPAGTLQDHQEARRLADRYAELLRPGRQILAFDPRGRGQVAEVFGDLATARRTSVFVPGSDIDLSSSDRARDPYGTPSGMAKSLRARMAAEAPGVRTAAIAWTGYTTPLGLGPDAATGRLAEAGAPRLARFLDGLAAVGVPAPALLCHSYGSVVCALAVPDLERGRISDLIVFGSPGMRTDSAAALRTTARVWAARDASDWIGNLPHVEFLGLGHGTDPTDPSSAPAGCPRGRPRDTPAISRPARTRCATSPTSRSAATTGCADGRGRPAHRHRSLPPFRHREKRPPWPPRSRPRSWLPSARPSAP